MKLVALALALALASTAPTPAPIAGRWVTDDGKALVVIAACGKAMCGRIVRILKPTPGKPQVDANNPDPRLRTRPIAGITILTGLTPASDGWRGNVYDPKSGRTYTARVWRAGAGLKVEGCWGVLCRTQDWTAAR